MRKIVCIVGESGAGKSAIVDEVTKKGYSQIKSYTTRAVRDKRDRLTHTFVSDEQFEALRPQLAAYTFFHGNKYGATKDQVRNNDLYVVDPAGVKSLIKNIGRQSLYIVQIQTSRDERLIRLISDRGAKQAYDRVEHDDTAYADLDYDAVIVNEVKEDFDKSVRELVQILESRSRS